MREWMGAKGEFNAGKQGQRKRNGLLKYSATHSPTAIYSLLLWLTQGSLHPCRFGALHNVPECCSVAVCKCVSYSP